METPKIAQIDLTRATTVDVAVQAQIEDLFEYHAWSHEQKADGLVVHDVLANAYAVIIEHVPPCPTRTRALNALTDSRMLCNAAITHRGKY